MSDENTNQDVKPEEVSETKVEDSTQVEQVQSAPQSAPEQSAPKYAPRAPGDENTIFIGRKSTMGYVLAVVTQFNTGASIVKIKARGKLISKAVDVAEITRGRFLPDVKTDNIIIKTEEVQNEDGSKSKISSIEIIVKK